MSYIIKNGSIIAKINADLPSGVQVRYSWLRVEEQIDAARCFNLVNAHYGKIGNGAKWDRAWGAMCCEEQMDHGEAVEINPGEFFIKLEEDCEDED